MSISSWKLSTALVLFLSVRAFGGVVTINYDLMPISGDTYRYVYTVSNNGGLGPGVPLTLFDVLFDPALYDFSSLTIVTPSPLSTQWSEMLFPPLIGVPAAYDVQATGPGIPDGGSASGFAVEFKWIGPGLPGGQPFEIFTDNFELAQTGATESTVPEPSAIFGITVALACGTLAIRRRRV
jgi:hypothetical protein